MTGAIEFLRKAKAIYNGCEMKCSEGIECPLEDICDDSGKYMFGIIKEADLVSKVMAYQLPSDTEDYKAEYEEAMKRDFNICDVCADNQLIDCAYLENDDRKSCAKVMAYKIKEVSE